MCHKVCSSNTLKMPTIQDMPLEVQQIIMNYTDVGETGWRTPYYGGNEIARIYYLYIESGLVTAAVHYHNTMMMPSKLDLDGYRHHRHHIHVSRPCMDWLVLDKDRAPADRKPDDDDYQIHLIKRALMNIHKL